MGLAATEGLGGLFWTMVLDHIHSFVSKPTGLGLYGANDRPAGLMLVEVRTGFQFLAQLPQTSRTNVEGNSDLKKIARHSRLFSCVHSIVENMIGMK